MTEPTEPTTEDVRESYMATGDGLDYKRRYFERAGEFDRWLQGVINSAYNEGYEAGSSGAHAPDSVQWEFVGEDSTFRRFTDKPRVAAQWLERGYAVRRRTKQIAAGPWESLAAEGSE